MQFCRYIDSVDFIIFIQLEASSTLMSLFLSSVSLLVRTTSPHTENLQQNDILFKILLWKILYINHLMNAMHQTSSIEVFFFL